MERKSMPHRVPLVKLPPSEWRIKDAGPIHFAVSVYGRVIEGQTTRHWQKWSILDFPNDLFGLEDLVSAGLDFRYVAAIEEQELVAANEPEGMMVYVIDSVTGFPWPEEELEFLQETFPNRLFYPLASASNERSNCVPAGRCCCHPGRRT